MPELRAPDGTMLAYDAYEPPPPQARAAVLWVCGWSDHRARWRHVGIALQAAGYAAYLLDQRGQGESGGRRGHLSRFSQLLGDLHAFRRVVRARSTTAPPPPQILIGHSFGGLVVLRYLETQPDDVAAAVLSAPWLGTAVPVPAWKRWLAELLTNVWPGLPIATRLDSALLARDPAVGRDYDENPAVHGVMTPGAWSEIRWAQAAVPADAGRIDVPMLFLVPGADRIADTTVTRALADGLKGDVQVRGFPDYYHELLNEPDREAVLSALLEFLDRFAGGAGTREGARP